MTSQSPVFVDPTGRRAKRAWVFGFISSRIIQVFLVFLVLALLHTVGLLRIPFIQGAAPAESLVSVDGNRAAIEQLEIESAIASGDATATTAAPDPGTSDLVAALEEPTVSTLSAVLDPTQTTASEPAPTTSTPPDSPITTLPPTDTTLPQVASEPPIPPSTTPTATTTATTTEPTTVPPTTEPPTVPSSVAPATTAPATTAPPTTVSPTTTSSTLPQSAIAQAASRLRRAVQQGNAASSAGLTADEAAAVCDPASGQRSDPFVDQGCIELGF